MKKLIALLLVAVMAFAVVACSGSTTPTPTPTPTPATGDPTATPSKTPVNPTEDTPTPTPWTRPETYERADDEDIYKEILGEYEKLINKAKAAPSIDEKFVIFAQAEAALLDSAVMIPTSTEGGAYTISRIAPRTVPYVQWGNDDDRLFGMVISDEFLTKEERADLLDQWAKAVKGEGTYDPAAYLTGKGHKIQKNYTTSFSTKCVTFDWLNTSSQSDTEITVNCVDGLVQYDNLNKMQPALAESWSVSDDGITYTFNIRKGVKWVTADGREYAEVTAKDFEAGFRHMLDAAAGLEWLVDGVIVGVSEYLGKPKTDDSGNPILDDEGNPVEMIYGSWADVGYKATGDYTLTVTLCAPTSYFLTMLTYSCFLPICESFYQSKGGVYGVEEFAAASSEGNYTYGINTDVSSQVYCGPFVINTFNDSEIILTPNEKYYNKDKVTLESIKWVHDSGENPKQYYADTVAGTYAGMGLGEASGTLKLAKEDGNFDKYAYISDTTSTSYFGGLNLNRGTFVLENGACASPATEQQHIDTHLALVNKDFRQALQYSFDKATQNAVRAGDDLKTKNLRNMYTHPEFVSLSTDVTVDGKEWKAGTFYGEMVQYYLEQLGSKVKVQDGIDGWFNPTAAKEAFAKAKPVLEAQGVTFPINIDVVYYSPSAVQTAQANAYKKGVEETLGVENVVVNLVEATVDTDYYASGYRAKNGEAGNFDMFYGSGWGPDYGDPSTYLDTFLGNGAGYMTKVVGLF